MHFGTGGFGLLLCFMGVLVAVGVRMDDGPAPIVPVVFGGARALAAFVHRNIAAVGLVMASCAFTALRRGRPDALLWHVRSGPGRAQPDQHRSSW
jgi:hypothetical protein